VRSLTDQPFDAVVAENCRAIASIELDHKELENRHMIYCNVVALLDQAMGSLADGAPAPTD
jgi:hypothetical protein